MTSTLLSEQYQHRTQQGGARTRGTKRPVHQTEQVATGKSLAALQTQLAGVRVRLPVEPLVVIVVGVCLDGFLPLAGGTWPRGWPS